MREEEKDFRRDFRLRVARMKMRLFIDRRLIGYYRRLMTEAEPLRAEMETKLEFGGQASS